MATYQWKSDKTKLLRMLRASVAMKRKKGWSRDTGCGFIAQDVKEYRLNNDKTIDIMFTWSGGRWSRFSMWSLNLRESEELLKHLEGKTMSEEEDLADATGMIDREIRRMNETIYLRGNGRRTIKICPHISFNEVELSEKNSSEYESPFTIICNVCQKTRPVVINSG